VSFSLDDQIGPIEASKCFRRSHLAKSTNRMVLNAAELLDSSDHPGLLVDVSGTLITLNPSGQIVSKARALKRSSGSFQQFFSVALALGCQDDCLWLAETKPSFFSAKTAKE